MKAGKARDLTTKLLATLCESGSARLVARDDGAHVLSGVGATGRLVVPDPLVRALLAEGLLREVEPKRYAASDVAKSWLQRRAAATSPFAGQHGRLETARIMEESGPAQVLVNRDESPLGPLSRTGRSGKAWLDAEAIAAAERLRRDFERGQLQPRITASWSASVSNGRRAGGKGLDDLTDMAMAARLRFDRAMAAAGPEFSGVLVDVCCFLKGLETVERERSWPARSAKLVLRLALAALARHYGLAAEATGKEEGRIQHWGAENYRPEIG